MFRKLVSFAEAQEILNKTLDPKPVGVESVSIGEVLDRVLVDDVKAPIDVPPFDRSTVDGYAVKATDTFGADEDQPISLRVSGEATAGSLPRASVQEGTAVEIATGAPIPEGADAVSMLEYSIRQKNVVRLLRPVSKGENVMKAGSDIRKGDVILKRNQRLVVRRIGILAALGISDVQVFKRPRLAVLSTGAEVVPGGTPLPKGKIYDVNAHSLSAAVHACGGDPLNLGIIQDEMAQLLATIKQALTTTDGIITSGGVSVGHKDVLPKVLHRLGRPGVIVSGIAVKPGKPTTIAIIKGKPVFSLPGHPTSSLLMFHLLVRPIVCKMAGRPVDSYPVVKAVAASKMFTARGRRTFVMVKLIHDQKGQLIVLPVPTGLSGAITTLGKADGFVEIAEQTQFVDKGEEVMVKCFDRSLSSSLL